MSVLQTIKSNPRLKSMVHRMLIPRGKARPRRWVKWFVNRFFHRYGAGASVSRRSRMDVVPFNKFEMGERSAVEDFCTVNNGVGDVTIGYDSLVGIGSVVIGPAAIGNHVILAQHVVISGLNHEYRDINIPIHLQKVSTSPVSIGDDSWIGANAVVTAGVHVGRHCIVAAGSVLTRDIPDFSVAAGNPAKVIKKYDTDLKEWVRVP